MPTSSPISHHCVSQYIICSCMKASGTTDSHCHLGSSCVSFRTCMPSVQGTAPPSYPPFPNPQPCISHQSQRKASDTLELELQAVVNRLMSMLGTETQVFWEHSKLCEVLSHLSSPESSFKHRYSMSSFTSFEKPCPTSQLALPQASSD